MTIQDASLLPLEVSRKYFTAALATTLSFFIFTQAALAHAGSTAPIKRRDQPLSLAMWSPPPDGKNWVYEEAHLGSPDAPFIFSGDTLYSGATFESTRPIFIDRAASVYTQAGTTLRFSGAMLNLGASAHGLLKYGAGTLALSGQNAYRGNTLLREGTLHVEGSSALGASYRTLEIFQGTELSYAPGAIVHNPMALRFETQSWLGPDGTTIAPATGPYADSIQWRVDSGRATQTGVVVGSVPIVKQGLGTLQLVGSITNPAYVTVNEGSLAVDGFFGGSVQVKRGARLEGSGAAISVTIQDGALFAPGMGSSTSEFTVIDSLAFQPGATLDLDLSSNGNSDRIHVMGKALLSGQVVARAAAGDWQPSTRYTFLRAEQGFDGTRFESAASTLAFLTPTLSYDEHQVYLQMDRNNTPIDDVAETPDEDDVGDAIDEGDNPGVYDKIMNMDRAQAREALKQLSGRFGASVLSGIIEDSRYVREAAMHNALPLPGEPSTEARHWHHTFYASADRNARSDAPADERHISGLVMGVQRPINSQWEAGAFFGVQQSRVRRQHATADARVDSVHAGLSLGGRISVADIAIGVAHSWNAVQSHRNVSIGGLHDVLTGGYRGSTRQLFAEIAAPLRWFSSRLKKLQQPRSHIAPFGRLALVHSDMESYTENGGAAALSVSSSSHTLLFSTVGVKAQHSVETQTGEAVVQGELAWRHASGDLHTATRQHFRDSDNKRMFKSHGHPVAQNAWQLRLGVEGSLRKHASLAMGYAGQYSRGRQNHGARLNLRWGF